MSFFFPNQPRTKAQEIADAKRRLVQINKNMEQLYDEEFEVKKKLAVLGQ